MLRFLMSLSVAVAVVSSSGCSGADEATLRQNQLAEMNELTATLTEIKDQAGVDANLSKLRGVCDRMVSTQEKLGKFGPQKPAVDPAARTQEDAYEDAGYAMLKQGMRVGNLDKTEAVRNLITTTIQKMKDARAHP